MVKILHDSDADASVLNGKTVAVIGYGRQGSAQANCLTSTRPGTPKPAGYALRSSPGKLHERFRCQCHYRFQTRSVR